MSLQFRESLKVAPSFVSVAKVFQAGEQLVSFLKPSSIVFSPGITETVRQTSNNLGVISEALRFVSSEIAALTMQFPGVDINVMEYKIGRLFIRTSGTTLYGGKDFLQLSNQVGGATNPDQIGFGIVADIPGATASIFRDNETVQLTQASFSSFNPATPDQFAIGSNGARRYSNNLLAARATVDFRIPVTFTNELALSAQTLPTFNIAVGFVTVNGQLIIFRAGNAQPILEGDVDFGADTVPVQWRINDAGCLSYEITYTGQFLFCA